MELIFNLQKLSGPCMRSVMWNRFSIENFAYRVLPYLPRGENSSLQRNVFKYFFALTHCIIRSSVFKDVREPLETFPSRSYRTE